MRRNRIVGTIVTIALAACTCLFLFGCDPEGTKEVNLESKVADSALVTPGTLTVGIDSTMAPFGGESNGEIIGVDVDVAAALASEMGLNLVVVDTSGQNATNLINEKKIDVAMSMAANQGANSNTMLVGPYLENGPVLFGKGNGTDLNVDITALGGTKVGAYRGSIAANAAGTFCGADNLVTFMSLSEAFDALQNGEVVYVASDAVSGGYLALSYNGAQYAASLQSPAGLFMGVAQAKKTLMRL